MATSYHEMVQTHKINMRICQNCTYRKLNGNIVMRMGQHLTMRWYKNKIVHKILELVTNTQ